MKFEFSQDYFTVSETEDTVNLTILHFDRTNETAGTDMTLLLSTTDVSAQGTYTVHIILDI